MVDFIYKIADRMMFERSLAAGRFLGAPIDQKDGYIHFSTAEQLAETLRLHFAGATDLVVFSVSAPALGDALRWEASRGGALFPHLYGELPMSAVLEKARVDVPADGKVVLPAFVK